MMRRTPREADFPSEGEQVTVEQLLYAMLLASANDAAIVSQRRAPGMDSFAEMMNEKPRN